jgi:Spy/CpxP family protein refolding chaperone
MKMHHKLVFGLAGLLWMVSPMVRADSGTVSATLPEHSKKHMTQLDALATQLHLTDDQKAKVGAILKDEKAAHKVLKKDASVPEEVKPARNREITDQHNSQIRDLLTPEQQSTFDQINAKAAVTKKL